MAVPAKGGKTTGTVQVLRTAPPERRCRYVTVRRVSHDRVDYVPGDDFPGPEATCTDAALAALLRCGAIREPDQPPRQEPTTVPALGDEETPGGDARHVPRFGPESA
jgi:hypothetical protein